MLIRTLPLLNKDHTFPAAGAALGRQSCSSKLAGAAEERERSKQQNVDRLNDKQINASPLQLATVIFVTLREGKPV